MGTAMKWSDFRDIVGGYSGVGGVSLIHMGQETAAGRELAKKLAEYDMDGILSCPIDGNLVEEKLRPEYFMPWTERIPHIMDLERVGWFPLRGMHIVLCKRRKFDNRFQAYEYLSFGRRPICVVSGGRFWGVMCWSDQCLPDLPPETARIDIE